MNPEPDTGTARATPAPAPRDDPLSRRSRLFADLAGAAEHELAARQVHAAPAAVDAALHGELMHAARAFDVAPSDALALVPDDLSATVADVVERRASVADLVDQLSP